MTTPGRSPLVTWLLDPAPATPGAAGRETAPRPWWKVMSLSGVDSLSTLAYQPAIAAVAAGAVAPLATLVLAALILLGALPVYRRVAAASPHGEGSLQMLAGLLPGWTGKLLILVLLGFAVTDFLLTITLSGAAAAAHLVGNPLLGAPLGGTPLATTVVVLLLLGAVFVRGFRGAASLAAALAVAYLGLSAAVIGHGLAEVAQRPELLAGWRALLARQEGGWLGVALAALIVFPRLALGLSGFETGVSAMAQVRGAPDDTPEDPRGRVRRTRRMLTVAALAVSALLLASSVVVTLLVPREAVQPGGPAAGRALAYLAHARLGPTFGHLYDLSTVLVLWFAGASAMTGLLSIVPRHLPRYGMAPDWARATRPLTLLLTALALVLTLYFQADVYAQGAAYATGVLVLITAAAFAVALSAWRARTRRRWGFALVTLAFVYTTVLNVVERPDGLRIASLFVVAILALSMVSRVRRATELRVSSVELDLAAREFVRDAARSGALRLIAHRPGAPMAREYRAKARDARLQTHLPDGGPVLFLEVTVANASDFGGTLAVRGRAVGSHHVLKLEAPAVPNAIAALLLYLRDHTGITPDVYFGWDTRGPLENAINFIFFGEGDLAPVTREILRRAEPNPARRPLVHVGG